MRILITGLSGLLGLNTALQMKTRHEVSGVYLSHSVQVEGIESFHLDLTNEDAVFKIFKKVSPHAVIHTAGYTNVDACEGNPTEAERLNVLVSKHVARAAVSVGASVVHISTDHLTDGAKSLADESVQVLPLNMYAQTKLEAERAVSRICPEALIVRTNFFGWGTPFKPSFSDWILDGLRRGQSVPLFVDVYITPILINDLAGIVERLLDRRAMGIYNIVGCERVSKYDFGTRLAGIFGCSSEVLRPVSVRDAPLRARRPQDMSLSADKVERFLGERMPSLDESLVRLKALGGQGWPEMVRGAIRCT